MRTDFAKQMLWKSMREIGDFSAGDLDKRCREIEDFDLSIYSIRRYIKSLEKGGYIKFLRHFKGTKLYQVVKHSISAPVVTDSSSSGKLDNYGRMWTTMRIFGGFTNQDISKCSEVPIGMVTVYLSQLVRAGFIQVVRKGKKGARAFYRLIKNTGPIAPRVVKKTKVFDLNTELFYSLEKEEIHHVG